MGSSRNSRAFLTRIHALERFFGSFGTRSVRKSQAFSRPSTNSIRHLSFARSKAMQTNRKETD